MSIRNQFRYVVRTSGDHRRLDVRDTATRAAVRAAALADELGVPMEVVRGDDTGDKTRICQVRTGPFGGIDWFVPKETA